MNSPNPAGRISPSLPLSVSPSSAAPAPLVLILALALKLRSCFAEVRQSSILLVQWARAHIGWQKRMSEEVRAIDDPLEALLPELEQCLANDPPAKRRRILAAYREVHYATESKSQALAPQCPGHLLTD